ncbi:acyltransferase [Variovorax sp. LjRoot290]|uniref:acyltransferase n=1 Tax=Variovorax sp. LjRoot290 TaxID=3342316 RepID=UPI003ED07115
MMDFLKKIYPDADRLLVEVSAAMLDTDRNRGLREDIVRRFMAQLLTDDERARLFGLPASCRVRENTKILQAEKLKCGEHVWIGENAYLDASGGLSIGDHSTIGVGVYVWTHTSVLANLLHENRPGGAHVVRRPTHIGAGCYIVGHSVINPGVRIGDGAVVLPMSCVSDDVPAGDIVAGAPAKSVGSVTEAFVARLKEELRRQRDEPGTDA